MVLSGKIISFLLGWIPLSARLDLQSSRIEYQHL